VRSARPNTDTVPVVSPRHIRHWRELEALDQFRAHATLAHPRRGDDERCPREGVLQHIGVKALQLGDLLFAAHRRRWSAKHAARREIARIFAHQHGTVGVAVDFEARFERCSGVHVESNAAGLRRLELCGGAVEGFASQIGFRHPCVADRDHGARFRKVADHLQRHAGGAQDLVTPRVLDAEDRDRLTAGQSFDANVLTGDIDQVLRDAALGRRIAEIVNHAGDHAADAESHARRAIARRARVGG